MLAMSIPLSSPAFLLVLASCFVFSGAVCSGCLENDVHLSWCWYSTDQPITGTDKNGQLGISSISSINSPDCPVGPDMLSPLSSTGQQQWTDSSAAASAISPSLMQRTCKLCGKVLKNSRGVSIRTARMHKSSSSASSVQVPLPIRTDVADITDSGAATVRLTTPSRECNHNSAELTVTTDCNSQSKVRLQSQQKTSSGVNADFGSVPSRVTTRSTNHTTARPNPIARLVCLCGKSCAGRVGLSSHQRSCNSFRRLMSDPIGQSTKESANQQTVLTAQTDLTQENSINSLENNISDFHANVSDLNLKTDSLDFSARNRVHNENDDLIKINNNYLTADRLDAGGLVFYFNSDLSVDRVVCDVDCAELVNHRIAVNRPTPPPPPFAFPSC